MTNQKRPPQPSQPPKPPRPVDCIGMKSTDINEITEWVADKIAEGYSVYNITSCAISDNKAKICEKPVLVSETTAIMMRANVPPEQLFEGMMTRVVNPDPSDADEDAEDDREDADGDINGIQSVFGIESRNPLNLQTEPGQIIPIIDCDSSMTEADIASFVYKMGVPNAFWEAG